MKIIVEGIRGIAIERVKAKDKYCIKCNHPMTERIVNPRILEEINDSCSSTRLILEMTIRDLIYCGNEKCSRAWLYTEVYHHGDKFAKKYLKMIKKIEKK